MPKKKPESKGASTNRARKFRARQRLRDLLRSHDAFVALDLQQFYESRQLSKGCWVSAEGFFSSYAPEHRDLLLKHSFAGTESAVAQINGRAVTLIRPKFLPTKGLTA